MSKVLDFRKFIIVLWVVAYKRHPHPQWFYLRLNTELKFSLLSITPWPWAPILFALSRVVAVRPFLSPLFSLLLNNIFLFYPIPFYSFYSFSLFSSSSSFLNISPATVKISEDLVAGFTNLEVKEHSQHDFLNSPRSNHNHV